MMLHQLLCSCKKEVEGGVKIDSAGINPVLAERKRQALYYCDDDTWTHYTCFSSGDISSRTHNL